MSRAEPILRRAMLKAARAYAHAHGIALSTASRHVFGDGKFLPRLASAEGTFEIASYDRVMDFLANPSHWPDRKVPELHDPTGAHFPIGVQEEASEGHS